MSWRESFFFFRGAWHHRVTSRQRIHVKDRFNRTTRPIENVETALSATSMKGTADSAQRHHDLTALQIAKAQHEDRPWNPFYKLLLSSLYFAWNTFHIVFFLLISCFYRVFFSWKAFNASSNESRLEPQDMQTYTKWTITLHQEIKSS